jgi:hypothetical protein
LISAWRPRRHPRKPVSATSRYVKDVLACKWLTLIILNLKLHVFQLPQKDTTSPLRVCFPGRDKRRELSLSECDRMVGLAPARKSVDVAERNSFQQHSDLVGSTRLHSTSDLMTHGADDAGHETRVELRSSFVYHDPVASP